MKATNKTKTNTKGSIKLIRKENLIWKKIVTIFLISIIVTNFAILAKTNTDYTLTNEILIKEIPNTNSSGLITELASSAFLSAGLITTTPFISNATPQLIKSLVSTFAKASTGTAISSLSGAAENSATLAIIGGGTLANDGGGIALGSKILSISSVAVPTVFIVATAITATIIYKKNKDKIDEFSASVENSIIEKSSKAAETLKQKGEETIDNICSIDNFGSDMIEKATTTSTNIINKISSTKRNITSFAQDKIHQKEN